MKKTLSSIIIVISLFSSQAYAKTEGNYLGINISKNALKIKSTSSVAQDNFEGINSFYNYNNKNSKYGFGLNYKHAFNFNNFFVAPEIAFDLLNNEINSSYIREYNNYFSQKIKLKNAITLKANFGYDFSDQFAFYIPFGISKIGYDIETTDVIGINNKGTKKSGYKSSAFIGFGFSYQPIKNWVVNLEYNKYQNFKITSQNATFNNGQIIAKINLDLMKLGISYRF
jgi:opacity protein-like surface antigen